MLTAIIVLTVGIGIGASTAIFAAVDAALLRPLPYADSGRLFWIYTDAPPFPQLSAPSRRGPFLYTDRSAS